MDFNLLSQYISNRYQSVDFNELELGGLKWVLDSEFSTNNLYLEDFSWDLYRPSTEAPSFEEDVDCSCGAVLPAHPSRVELTKQLVVVACISESQAKGYVSGREKIVLGFDVSFKNLLRSFILKLDKLIIDEITSNIGNNPKNSPISPLPRVASLWDFVNSRPDAMGAVDFKHELLDINLSRYSMIGGGKFAFACQHNGMACHADSNFPLLDGVVIDNLFCVGMVKPLMGLNSFQLRVNGVNVGVKPIANSCNDSDIRLIIGVRYGVFCSKNLLETGVYHYKLQ